MFLGEIISLYDEKTFIGHCRIILLLLTVIVDFLEVVPTAFGCKPVEY